ncbi:MAG: hypothetical protein MUC49_08265 [Raineya sp.]|jgi:hypothetical protein|nr:hypothetical protein [Raineya sp.]
MKLIICFFIGFLIFSSCEKQAENASHLFHVKIPSKEVLDSIIESKRFIPKDSILAYIKNTPTNNFKEFKGHPFDSIQFNKLIAYEFDWMEDRYRYIVDENNQLVPSILQQVALKLDDVYFLTRLLSNKNTYGGGEGGCFMPHLGLVFYQDNKIIMHISICYICNLLESSIPIPAEKSSQYAGFNKNARKYLRYFLDKHHFPYSKHKSILDE